MNGQLSKNIRAIVTVVLCLLAVSGIALFATVNLSPLFIHLPARGQFNLGEGVIRADYCRLLVYLQQPWPTRLSLANIPLSSHAVDHFRDVRHLLLIGEAVGLVSMVLGVWLLAKQKRQGQLLSVLLPLKWLFYMIVMTVWIPLINFSRDFVCFHQLLFNNQDWIFVPSRDPIILVMPEEFFWHLFIIFVVIAITLLLLLWGWLASQLGLFKLRTDKTDDGRNQGYHDNS
ncbi:TIGR01906 family membrane protein [uncultured Limosilactobacillus sp.]|uniref:TIGR01906 family membrane protein n=1 Tax=uncultured Limosilactobacillus sp. TaxID=2837629 RepID=UPI002591C9EE|nr:TIGR01906 family membrane protein [uncultured Limosilactobacillus sp.]